MNNCANPSALHDGAEGHKSRITLREWWAGINWRQVLPRLFMFLFAIAITLVIIIYRDTLGQFSRYGLLGIFIINVLGNATLVMPAPTIAFVFAFGSTMPAWQVGLAAGLGSTLGEIVGYMAGYAGSAIVEDRARYERVRAYMNRYGPFAIFVLAFIPNPLFDLAGIAAGTLKMPLWEFLLPCWAGKTLKMLAVAYAGAGSITFLTSLFQSF